MKSKGAEKGEKEYLPTERKREFFLSRKKKRKSEVAKMIVLELFDSIIYKNFILT